MFKNLIFRKIHYFPFYLPSKEDHRLRMWILLQHYSEEGAASREHQFVCTHNVTITYLPEIELIKIFCNVWVWNMMYDCLFALLWPFITNLVHILQAIKVNFINNTARSELYIYFIIWMKRKHFFSNIKELKLVCNLKFHFHHENLEPVLKHFYLFKDTGCEYCRFCLIKTTNIESIK